jgi:subtilisin family serine protease
VRALFACAVLISAALPLRAADSEFVSTYCREVDIPLDAVHMSSRLAGCGDDAHVDLLWHLDRIDQLDGNLDGRYHRRHAGAGSVVYVMDTGVLATHVEFGNRVIGGFDAAASLTVGSSNCASKNKAIEPCYSNWSELVGASHGTSVASLVAGENVGVAPEATIVSVRVMNESALATTRTYLEGLNFIIRNAWDPNTPPFHTAVVNISGWILEKLASMPDPSPVPFSVVEKKIRDMIGGVDADGKPDPNGKRFLFVVAGNNIDNGCGRAGKQIDGLITVGGMTEDNSWWPGACKGGLEILAPSQDIFSATITGTDHYRGRSPNLRSGTSFAAPIIAGIAARILSENPLMNPPEIEAMIESTPSRIFNPDSTHADGKVAFVQDAPAVQTARVAP